MQRFKSYLQESTYTLSSLKKDYKHFNSILFNNELPEIKLVLAKKSLKGYSGWVKTKYLYKQNNISSAQIQELMVSSEYEDDSIRGLLIHEMIHVWMVLNDYHEDMNVVLHGKEFMKKLKEIQKRTDIKIPLDENDHNLKLRIDLTYKNYEEPDWMKEILAKYKS